MTAKDEIATWFDEGVEQGATHMIVVCDSFDYKNRPVFVSPTEDVYQSYNEYDSKEMQRVMEVYSLKKDKATQLEEKRAFHFD